MLLGGEHGLEHEHRIECGVRDRGELGDDLVGLARRRGERMGFIPPGAALFAGVRTGFEERWCSVFSAVNSPVDYILE